MSRTPKQTRFGHSPLTKPKGGGTSVGETRTGLVSERPTRGRQWTSISKIVSKVLKILPGLYKETVGQRSVSSWRWAVQVRSHGIGVSHGGLDGSGQLLWLEGMVFVPIRGCFTLRVFCLSSEISWKELN